MLLSNCWGGTLSVKKTVLLDLIVRSASKPIGTTLPTVNELYETCVMKKTRDILKDTSHPLHVILHTHTHIWYVDIYIRYRARTIYIYMYTPMEHLKFMLARKGEGKVIREDGRKYNGAHNYIYKYWIKSITCVMLCICDISTTYIVSYIWGTI